jgi:hypothetical protein
MSGRNFGSDEFNLGNGAIAFGQIPDRIHSEVEITNKGGLVDGGHLDRHARPWVGDVPARAAIIGVIPHDVECTANEREGTSPSTCHFSRTLASLHVTDNIETPAWSNTGSTVASRGVSGFGCDVPGARGRAWATCASKNARAKVAEKILLTIVK